MLKRHLLSNGGYLRLNFFIHDHKIPPLEFDALGFVGTLETPLWGIKRILYWTAYEKLSDGYEIWKLRKNTYSNEDTNKACEYLKALHPVMNCGWSTWTIRLSNTTIFSGFSLVGAGKISLSGIRRIGVYDLQSVKLVQRIDAITERYFTSIKNTVANDISGELKKT
jgi:hypothetical protein